MLGLPLAFAFPLVLGALVALPVIWWLLRLTPPKPQAEVFPPLAILARLVRKEETPAKSPWWLTLLRLAMAALVILAMAGPVWNPETPKLSGEGPVLIIADNGWASGRDWERQNETALGLIEEARETGRTVYLLGTADAEASANEALDPDRAQARMDAMENQPLKPDHAESARIAAQIITDANPGSVYFLSDGLDHEGSAALAEAIGAANGQKAVVRPPLGGLLAIGEVRNDPDAMTGTLLRPADAPAGRTVVTAFDIKGLPLARADLELPAGQTETGFSFEEPVELRNQIARLSVEEAGNAGAVHLLDESFRRRLVGLVSGEAADISQPLLSPLYYINRALSPFSDIRRADDANVAAAIPDLIQQGVSAIIMADIGNLPEETGEELTRWIGRGGMLIRFAGPRLAAAPEDNLLPVQLRRGDRSLGGALSWETPKPVASFESGSPFFGLEAPREVLVTRQVLALQDINLDDRTWAVLDDGTPLVTAARREAGWIVLFHVSSDATWSNLPISGTFVEMLRRVVNQSRAGGPASQFGEERQLPPMQILDGQGRLGAPPAEAKPLVVSATETPEPNIDNPPGLYGTEDGFAALNLFDENEELTPLDVSAFASSVQVAAYSAAESIAFKPWLLAAAGILLLLDCLAVLWISGSLRFDRRRGAAGGASAVVMLLALAATLFLASGEAARAQQDAAETDFGAALETRLAYVVTGDATTDEVSRAGMYGLTQFLTARTALEPGEPVGLDLANDELAFYALIYWPISLDAPLPDAATMARVDAFMKQGGSILFDTRDQFNGLTGGTANSAEAQRLQVILSSLDIPPLEPVPPDHVLTKAFYLLDNFPGRYAGGELWVESIGAVQDDGTRPARAGDGVSSILITSNDFAAAWALDENFRPIYSTIPPDPIQRELSFRTGVNLMMYALTGNYKADQVHIPALLERLGQ